MSELFAGSSCRVGIDSCKEGTVCLKSGTQSTGVCRTLCINKDCPDDFSCLFVAFDGAFQHVCMPKYGIPLPNHKSEHNAKKFELEDILFYAFGLFFIILLYQVLKACFGSSDEKRQTKQQNNRTTFQPQAMFHTPGCPACIAQYNIQQQSFTRPPPYNPSNFRQV